MNHERNMGLKDYGPNPVVLDVNRMVMQNPNFRTAVWTGHCLQMTLMCIPPRGEVGLEIHPDTDQMLRVEEGKATVQFGICECRQDFRQQEACEGEVIFVPAGTWHNICNMERFPLRLSSVYAPPNHPRGTVHRTKEEADREEHR